MEQPREGADGKQFGSRKFGEAEAGRATQSAVRHSLLTDSAERTIQWRHEQRIADPLPIGDWIKWLFTSRTEQ